ncbi:sporulation integral membrane protein YlbJ [Paenibacillus sp. OSY-SE]|uniref:sporulation integral membrane protein YlbJ n=1 Tax=Paenibacillus sp. OSY-SE TaxID=1196323 RepID=UPI00030D3D20|nr:sporulation integral membrane protein YlbJ [Paenibacillus sp. OSY-SE]
MKRRTSRSYLAPLLIAGVCGLFLILMAAHPSTVLDAATRGLSIWWDVLFPSLLPFFIISEALLGFGIVHFIGTLLDPVMRPLFRIPGIGGFVVAMGYASGYPVGAKLTTRLRIQNLITREEGERLVAFTTSSDPIFLIGAVAVSFFGNAGLALTLALAHYGSGLLVGIVMRFYAPHAPLTPMDNTSPAKGVGNIKGTFIFRRAFHAMHEARKQDGRPLGTLLKEAVDSSLKLMIVVGGLVVFFSVVMDLLAVIGIMPFWEHLLQLLLQTFHLSPDLAPAFTGGLFEVTLGAKSAGAAVSAGTHAQVVAAAWVLSWAGLSVHAQIASIMNQSDLRYMPFLFARLVHSVGAAVAAYWLYPLLMRLEPQLSAWLPYQGHSAAWMSPWETAWSSMRVGLVLAALFFILMCLISFLIETMRLNRR